MIKVLLLNFVVLSTSIFQTWGHKLLQPYGPRLCDMYCQKTKGCFGHKFDEVHLTCVLVGDATNSKYSPIKTEFRHVCVLPKGNDMMHAGVAGQIRSSSSLTDEKRTVQKEDANDCPDIDSEDYDFIDRCVDSLDDVKRLVCQGMVNINCRDVWKETCVMQAAVYNNSEMFDFLIQNGCDISTVNHENKTVLHFACEGGNMYMVKKLVDDHNRDIHWRNNDGETPLFYAKNVPVVKFLKARGANLSSVDDYHNTILHKACYGGHVNVVRYVLSLGIIDLECKGEDGKTPLMKAVENNQRQLVGILHMEYGACLTSSDDDGFNVVHTACLAGHLDMVKYLVTQKKLRGLAKRKDNEGQTPMFWAIKKGHVNIVYFLKSLK